MNLTKNQEEAVGISGLGIYTPANSVAITELAEYSNLSAEAKHFFAHAGIDSIHVEPTQSCVEMAASAARNALAAAQLQPHDLDIIILLQSRHPIYLMSSEATYLQHQLNASKAHCFTQSGLGCVDISSAILLAQRLLQNSTDLKHILIAHGSRPITQHRCRYPVTVTGDGGGAIILSRSQQNVIVDGKVESNGEFWDLFKIDYKNKPWVEWEEQCSDFHRYSFQLAIASTNHFATLNKDLLTKHQLDYASIAYFIMQNISKNAYQFYQQYFSIQFLKDCAENLKIYGHLGPIDLILNLHTAFIQKRVKPGEHVLLMNNSPVAAWSSILMRI